MDSVATLLKRTRAIQKGNTIMSMPLSYITTTTNLNDLFKSIRRHERMNANLRVELEFAGEQKKLFAQTSDISLGGMACYISKEMAAQEQLVVVMPLPYSRDTLRLSATVRSRNSFRYGMEFTDISAEDQAKLQKCMNTLQ